jgi:hypothetical protein
MATEIILGIAIVGTVVSIAVASRWSFEEWLQAFVVVAQSLWRPL